MSSDIQIIRLGPKRSSFQHAAGASGHLRDLAERCGLPPLRLLPTLVSKSLEEPRFDSPARRYVCHWARHPDPDSCFEKATRNVPRASDEALITTLLSRGYDGLLYEYGGKVVGHVFFQRRGPDLCAFSSALSTDYRRGRSWATLVADFLAFASREGGIKRARIGAGNHPITRAFVTLLKPHSAELGWRVSRDGWVEFTATVTAAKQFKS